MIIGVRMKIREAIISRKIGKVAVESCGIKEWATKIKRKGKTGKERREDSPEGLTRVVKEKDQRLVWLT